MMTKTELNHKLTMLLDPEKPTLDLLQRLGYDLDELKKEIKLRLLYRLGLIQRPLTIKEFAILSGTSKSWVELHKEELQFHKIGGVWKTNIRYLIAHMSGWGTRRGSSIEENKETGKG